MSSSLLVWVAGCRHIGVVVCLRAAPRSSCLLVWAVDDHNALRYTISWLLKYLLFTNLLTYVGNYKELLILRSSRITSTFVWQVYLTQVCVIQVWLQGGHLGCWRCRLHTSDGLAAFSQVTLRHTQSWWHAVEPS